MRLSTCSRRSIRVCPFPAAVNPVGAVAGRHRPLRPHPAGRCARPRPRVPVSNGLRELDLGVPDSEAMSIARELLLPFTGSKTVVARVDDHRAENANPPSSGAPSRRHRNGNDGPERDPGPYFWRELRGEQLRLDADSGAMKVARAVPEQSNLLKWAVLYYCRRNGDDGLGRGPEPYLAWRPMATQLELNTRQGSA